MKNYFLLILLILNIGYTSAQTDVQISPELKKVKYDTTRIIDMSSNLSLWAYGINKQYSLELKNENVKNKLHVKPNGQTNYGFGFNYKWMGLGIAFHIPGSDTDEDKYGKTQRLDLQFNVFARSFGIDFSSQYYKGYYIDNPEKFMSWTEARRPLLPELQTASISLSGYYFTNHEKFSYRAAYVRNDIQKKGAGSLIVGAYARLDLAHTPDNANTEGIDGFISPEMLPSLRDTFDIYAYTATNVGLSVGYTFTFVLWKNLFINLSLVPGFGGRSVEINTSSGTNKLSKGLSAQLVSRAALGFEHKYFFTGMATINTTGSFKYDPLTVSYTTTKFRIYVGKRFNLRKKK